MRILIVRTDRLGDLVLTLPMARAIKRERPEATVLLLVREYTRPIAERSPDVDEVVVYPEHLTARERTDLFRAIRADVVFFPNARLDTALAARRARIRRRVGTAYRWYSSLFTDRIHDHRKSGDRSEAVLNLRMLPSIGVTYDCAELPQLELQRAEGEAAREWLGERSISRFAVLHAVSSGSSKDWPRDRFAALARVLTGRGLDVVLTGTASDREQLLSIAAETQLPSGNVHLFIAKPIEELAALLQRATIVVSNSTGPGHLAAALGTPSVGLFPLPPALRKERWGFRGPNAINISPQPIAGCPTCSECTCMQRITVEDVLLRIEN